MKKLILLLHFIVCLLTFSFGQTVAPGIEWQNTIGGSEYDELRSIEQTKDGGYILAGSSQSNISGDKTDTCIGSSDYWIIKIDIGGYIQWQKTIGGYNSDGPTSVEQTSDGGYILGGASSSNISGDKMENNLDTTLITGDYWIVRIDSIGNILWENTIGGSRSDALFSIQQTKDGGFILGGYSDSDSSVDKSENNFGGSEDFDYWIVKIDSLGNILWDNTIGGGSDDFLYSLQQTTDGGYILGGISGSNISGDKTESNIGGMDYWIVKTDSAGTIQWQNTIGGSDFEITLSVEQTADGGYILGGSSDSNISGDKSENNIDSIFQLTQDYWIVKTDSAGNINWQNTIGGDGQDALFSIHETINGGYILGGYSTSAVSGDKTENCFGSTDYWIVKTDSLGNVLWQRTIGGTTFDNLYTLQQTTDGGYVFGGASRSNISSTKSENCLGSYDYWVVKLYPDTTTGITTPSSTALNTQTTPNPFTNELTVSFPQLNSAAQLTLYDVFGKQVLTQTIPAKTLNLKLQTLNLAQGVYFLQLQSGKQTVTRKVVKM